MALGWTAIIFTLKHNQGFKRPDVTIVIWCDGNKAELN